MAALAAVEADGGRWRVALRGRVVSLEGDVTCEGTLDMQVASEGEAEGLGERLAGRLLEDGAGPVLDAARMHAQSGA